MELQGQLSELADSGLGVAAISYDSQDVLSKFAALRDITFPLLSDSDSATIKAFGILNTVAEEGLGPNREDPASELRDMEIVTAGRSCTGMPGAFLNI